MLQFTDPRVVSFYNFIKDKPKNTDGYFIGSSQNQTGLLYVMGGDNPMIQVWLPIELIDYANAAAGTSGDRPVGIRVTGYASVAAAAREILRIFDNPTNLAAFINRSECDYHQVYGARLQQKLARLQPKRVMANSPDGGFWSKYSRDDMVRVKAAFKDHKTLISDFQTMSLEDFEDKYELVDCLAV
jgi:hypothetical protein